MCNEEDLQIWNLRKLLRFDQNKQRCQGTCWGCLCGLVGLLLFPKKLSQNKFELTHNSFAQIGHSFASHVVTVGCALIPLARTSISLKLQNWLFTVLPV